MDFSKNSLCPLNSNLTDYIDSKINTRLLTTITYSTSITNGNVVKLIWDYLKANVASNNLNHIMISMWYTYAPLRYGGIVNKDGYTNNVKFTVAYCGLAEGIHLEVYFLSNTVYIAGGGGSVSNQSSTANNHTESKIYWI